MLVLSRKQGQKLRVGDDIIITITQVRKGRVSIGVDAPPEIAILREEVSPIPPKTAAGPLGLRVSVARDEPVESGMPVV